MAVETTFFPSWLPYKKWSTWRDDQQTQHHAGHARDGWGRRGEVSKMDGETITEDCRPAQKFKQLLPFPSPHPFRYLDRFRIYLFSLFSPQARSTTRFSQLIMAQHLYLAGNWAEYLEKSTELIDSVSVSKCGKYFLLLNRARAHLELGSNRICVQDCSDASKLLKSFAPEVVPVRAFDYQIRAYRALQNPQLAERVWSVLRERVEGKQAATVSSIIDLELYSSIKQRCENPGQKLSAVVPSPTSAIVSNGGSLTEKAIPGRLPPRRLVSHLTQGDIALQLKVSEGYQRVNSGDLPQSLVRCICCLGIALCLFFDNLDSTWIRLFSTTCWHRIQIWKVLELAGDQCLRCRFVAPRLVSTLQNYPLCVLCFLESI